MPEPLDPKDVAAAIEKVTTLQAEYDAAERKASDARREEISALNLLNDAQKSLDAIIASLKKAASRQSHWKMAPRSAAFGASD